MSQYIWVSPGMRAYLKGTQRGNRSYKKRLRALRDDLPTVLPQLFSEIRLLLEIENDAKREKIKEALQVAMEGRDLSTLLIEGEPERKEKVILPLVKSLYPEEIQPVLDSIAQQVNASDEVWEKFSQFMEATKESRRRIGKFLPDELRAAKHWHNVIDIIFPGLEAREITDNEINDAIKSYQKSELLRSELNLENTAIKFLQKTKNSPTIREICCKASVEKKALQNSFTIDRKFRIRSFLINEKLVERINHVYFATDRGLQVFGLSSHYAAKGRKWHIQHLGRRLERK